MSMLNWGVIAIKDGKLISNSKDISQGTAGFAKINNIEFERNCIRFNDDSFDSWTLFESSYTEKVRLVIKYRVRHLNANGIDLKVKCYGGNYQNNMLITTFRFNNSNYAILQGYDVSLDNWFEKRHEKLCKKFLNKHLRKDDH